MNKVSLTFVVIFLLLFFSCKNKSSDAVIVFSNNDFKIKAEIFGEQIIEEDYNINREIFAIDTLLILKTGSGKEYFNVYNKNSFEFLGSIGVRGEGPEEWQVISFNGQFDFTNKNSIGMWVSNFRKGFISKVNIHKTLKSENSLPVIDKTFRIDGKLFPFFNPFHLEEGSFISKSWITEDEFVRIKYFDLSKKETKNTGLFPKIKNIDYLPAEVINTLYTSSFKKHPEKNIYGQALYYFNRIDIFDHELNNLISIVEGETWKDFYFDAANVNIESDFLKEFKQFYSGLFLSNSYIYALSLSEQVANTKKYLRVFNYNGSPVAILEFDDEIYSFSVDENDEYLYAIDRENEKILKYNLKNIIKDSLK